MPPTEIQASRHLSSPLCPASHPGSSLLPLCLCKAEVLRTEPLGGVTIKALKVLSSESLGVLSTKSWEVLSTESLDTYCTLPLRTYPHTFPSPGKAAPAFHLLPTSCPTRPSPRLPALPSRCLSLQASVHSHHTLPTRAAHRAGCCISECLGKDGQTDTQKDELTDDRERVEGMEGHRGQGGREGQTPCFRS